MSDQEISAIRASCRKHNGTYRRKLRKLYSESPAAAQIINNQVNNGFLTEQEFQIRECCKCTQFVRTFWRLFPQFRSFWMSLKSNRKKNIFNPFKKNSKNHVSRYLLYFNICYSASFVHDDNKFFVLNDQIFLKLFNI